MTIQRPPCLYKYQSFSTLALTNLKRAKIWFCAPTAFNDPFDCSIPVQAVITESDYAEVFAAYRAQVPDKADLDLRCLQADGSLSELFKSQVERSLRLGLDRARREFTEGRGVACFSARRDHLLMWSHYADGHRGFCLEFDTSRDPFHRAEPVLYQKELPSAHPAAFLSDARNHQADEAFNAFVRTKVDAWRYEEEWRIIHAQGGTEYGYEPAALSGVYFGCAMPFAHIEIITLILRGSPTKLYRMQRSPDRFAVDSQLVEYTPCHERSDLSAEGQGR
jgi:hypothetical protein